jgi:hypothetical protein
MNSLPKKARIAGLLYILTSIPVGFSLTYGAAAFVVWDDAAATAHKIRASETLFRFCIAGELLSAIGFLFVVLALYRLFEGFDKRLASLMVTLWVISIPISFLNVLNEIAVLDLVKGVNFAAVLDPRQLNALVMLFLDLHKYGILLAQIFWGLWLLPLGLLVLRSGFLPRIIGVLLVAACVGYVASSVAFVLWPAHGDAVAKIAVVLGALGELPTMLWLMIKGAEVRT